MIKDYIKENSINYPDKTFIVINNKSISYKDFNDYVYAIEQLICSQKKYPNKIKINCLKQCNILASIIACNRLKVIPIVFPPKDKLIKFIDYDKIAKSEFELNDNNCIIQYKKKDRRKSIFFNENDVQCILFTSGSEMNPRAVELTFANFYNSALNWNDVVCFNVSDKYLNILPLWHISGLSIFFRSIYYNFKSIISSYKKDKILSIIKKYSINCISVVPKMIDDLIVLENKEFFLNNFKVVIIGGDAINENIFNYLKNKNIKAYISYGMTETSSGISGYFVSNIDKYMDGFLGSAQGNTIININRGHIVVKSNTVMKKYINSKKCNGRFSTNDLGFFLNKKLFYKSRSSNFIISGGENINLNIIKNVIIGYNKNMKIKITGIKDSKWGQVPVVLIERNKYDINEIKKHCKRYLPKYMVPKYFLNASEILEIDKKNII